VTFLEAVNRVLRESGILRGDDDTIASFSDTQHNAALNLAIVAIQNELAGLVSDRLIPYEKTSGTIATVSGTRAYAVESNFVRFYGQSPFFFDSANNRHIYEWPGGLDNLRHTIYTYATEAGYPNWWYWEDATTKKVAFYQVPNEALTLTYDYEKDVSVTNAADTLPFHTETEARTFVSMAVPHFKLLLTRQSLSGLPEDAGYIRAKAVLADLIKPRNPRNRYGARYV
jgi:hypothetical protein